MRDRWMTAGQPPVRLQHGLLACALLFGAYGCAVLAGAGTPFPDKAPASEAPAKSSIPTVAPPPQIPPFQASSPLSPEPQPQSLPLLEPLVVTELDEVAPLPELDEPILTLLLSEPLPVTDLLRLLLRETAANRPASPGFCLLSPDRRVPRDTL